MPDKKTKTPLDSIIEYEKLRRFECQKCGEVHFNKVTWCVKCNGGPIEELNSKTTEEKKAKS